MPSKIPQPLIAGVTFASLLFSAIGLASQSTPNRSLLALSKRNHTLAIVDPNTLQVIARAPVGVDPHEVIASSDGKTAYVDLRWREIPCSLRDRFGRAESAARYSYRSLECAPRARV